MNKFNELQGGHMLKFNESKTPCSKLIIIVSVSIFGLLVFVFVKNYIRNKINRLVKDEDKENLK